LQRGRVKTRQEKFREICIKPHVLGDLTQASASFKTVRGMVHVPKTGLRNVAVTESGRSVWKAGAFVTGTPGLYTASEDSEYITFDVGSGSYSFELTGQRD
jgi:hypothetical protein